MFAQEATPAAQTATQQEIDFEAQRAQAHDSFVAALAAGLGVEESAVDAAIRTALTQQVDEREAAGNLNTEESAAMRAVMGVSEAPLSLGFGGRGGMHGFGGRDGRHGPGDHDGDDRIDEDSPAMLPNDEESSDQSATAPQVPDESPAKAAAMGRPGLSLPITLTNAAPF